MGHRELSRDQSGIWSRVVLCSITWLVSEHSGSSLKIGAPTERETPVQWAIPGSPEATLCGWCLMTVSPRPLLGLEELENSHLCACWDPLIESDWRG